MPLDASAVAKLLHEFGPAHGPLARVTIPYRGGGPV